MDYVSTFYDNFDALLEGDHQTATLLLKELGLDESDIGTKPWMDDALTVYPDVEEYAVYELVDGWYMNHDLAATSVAHQIRFTLLTSKYSDNV